MTTKRLCKVCKVEKLLTEFPKQNGDKNNYRRHQCLPCFSGDTNGLLRQKKQWLVRLKKTMSCAHCQFNDHRALEFHHRDPTEKEMAISLAYGWSRERLLSEIEKCDVLCVNCHRIVHIDIRIDSRKEPSSSVKRAPLVRSYTKPDERLCRDCGVVKPIEQFNIGKIADGKTYYRHDCKQCKLEKNKSRGQTLQKWFVDYKKTLKCSCCGNADDRVLEFHHEDPSSKDNEVSQAVVNCWSIERIMKEIAKCIVLCGNCHRIHHHEERVAAKKKSSKTPCIKDEPRI